MLYVLYQSDFDGYHENADRTSRLSTFITMGEGGDETPLTSICLGPLLKKNNPYVVEYTRFNPYNFKPFLIEHQGQSYKEDGILGAEPSVFRIFTHPMIAGDAANALIKPNSIVLTKSLALKYFGTVECLDKLLKVNYEEYIVTGVIEDLPGNSDLEFRALISEIYEESDDWDDLRYWTYVVVDKERTSAELNDALKLIKTRYADPYYRESGMDISLGLKATPLRDVHFTAGLVYDTPKSSYVYIYVFLIVGLFILCIASFNYINLSTLQSFKRSKEVGLKGVLGATRGQLVLQFVLESLTLTFFSLFIAIIVVAIVLPSFNSAAQLRISFADVFHWKSLALMVMMVLMLGVISSVVPALYLTSLGTNRILKEKLSGFNSGMLYKVLLTTQFAMSVTMIIGTMAVYRQVKFMREKDLGFRMDQVLTVYLEGEMDFNDNTSFKKELLRFSSIKGASLIGEAAAPGSVGIEKSDVIVEREGKDAATDIFNTVGIDEDYFALLGIELIEGRNFDPNIQEDLKHSFVVNEAFIRHVGWQHAIDKKLELHGPGKVIGVVKDFNYKSLHNVVEPLIMHYNIGGPGNEMLVKVNSLSDIDVLKQVWRKVAGGSPLHFSFLDVNFDKQYQQEQTVMTMFFVFSFLVIVLTCQGLFGLSSLITRQRIKEIGIRKVLGGDELNIIYVLLKDTLILLAISLLVAAPVAYFGIGRWLRDFAYQANIGIEIYLGAWVLTMITTVTTGYYHTHKGVNTNPAISLRHDN